MEQITMITVEKTEALKHYISFSYKSEDPAVQEKINMEIKEFANVEAAGRYLPGKDHVKWGMVILARQSMDLFFWMKNNPELENVDIPADRYIKTIEK